jgi:predicted ATPase/class 3 adenylate cyclase
MTAAGLVTFLFTDIEGSSRLWESDPERMRPALARHDALVRGAVARHHGTVVKMLGDGVHAAFEDPLDAIGAIVELQLAMAATPSDGGLALKIRSGLNCGAVERRDDDYFGSPVNRAARIMSVAHGGQILMSQSVVALMQDRAPPNVSFRDLGLVRLRDLTSPEHVYQVVHPRLRNDFPALRSLEATPNNLPQQVTSFIGRERELAEVKRLFATTRLLTLLGAGGIGKTRAALHAAAEVLDDHPDGVWFVDLAPQSDPSLVPQLVASVLGVKEDPGRTVTEALVSYVKDKRILLILDNCEHLILACAELATALLRAGARLKILAASREPLRIAGESTFPIPALAVPDARTKLAPETLQHYEATSLFIERATAANASFEATARNAPAIVDICRRLDGIPLAIELAAARVRALPVETIDARLSDRFRLLAGGDQTARPRQQTLRALIDWSYDLLTEPEKALLRRLSVFAGGWTLDAAEAVGGDDDLPMTDVLDVLTNLVEKSLVAIDAGGNRYRLLETVREYAQGKLDDSGTLTAARSRHLAYFARYAEALRSSMRGGDPRGYLDRMDAERENLLVAHAWASSDPDGGVLGLSLAYGIGRYLLERGQADLGRRLTAEALDRPGAKTMSRIRALALFEGGWQACSMGRFDIASAWLEEGLGIARELEDRKLIGMLLQPLGVASSGRGAFDAARAYAEESVELARGFGDSRELAAAMTNLAQIHRITGKLDLAEPLYASAVDLVRSIGDREGVAICLLNLAMVSIGRGAGGPVREMLIEVVDIVVEIDSRPLGLNALDVSAGYGASRQEWERAVRLYGIAQAQADETGLQRDPTDEAFLAPLIEAARRALGNAAYEAAERAGRALGFEQGIDEARSWLTRAS